MRAPAPPAACRAQVPVARPRALPTSPARSGAARRPRTRRTRPVVAEPPADQVDRVQHVLPAAEPVRARRPWGRRARSTGACGRCGGGCRDSRGFGLCRREVAMSSSSGGPARGAGPPWSTPRADARRRRGRASRAPAHGRSRPRRAIGSSAPSNAPGTGERCHAQHHDPGDGRIAPTKSPAAGRVPLGPPRALPPATPPPPPPARAIRRRSASRVLRWLPAAWRPEQFDRRVERNGIQPRSAYQHNPNISPALLGTTASLVGQPWPVGAFPDPTSPTPKYAPHSAGSSGPPAPPAWPAGKAHDTHMYVSRAPLTRALRVLRRSGARVSDAQRHSRGVTDDTGCGG